MLNKTIYGYRFIITRGRRRRLISKKLNQTVFTIASDVEENVRHIINSLEVHFEVLLTVFGEFTVLRRRDESSEF